MNRNLRKTIQCMLIVSATAAPAALAQTYDVRSSTIDSGGGTSSGGGFELRGTIGQPDALPPDEPLTGGQFSLTGGFWSSRIVGPTTPGDCDADGDIDQDDYAVFAGCLFGPDAGLGPGCACIDLDNNGHVDLKDFASFQGAFTN